MNHGPEHQGPEGLDSDELALRRMLHQAVQEIEPRDGTLDHLRRAVPARRARKRHAAVCMAAAALFIGTAIPALVHASDSTGSDTDPSMAGHHSQAQGGAGQEKGETSGSSSSDGSSDSSKDTGKESDKGKDEESKDEESKDEESKDETSGVTGPAPEATASVDSTPACTAAELGGASARVGSPDSASAVYGTFRVSNVSGTSCTVTGAGSVGTVAQGAADASKISVANHVAGDEATGLPDPFLAVTQLVLQPGAAYEVKFAWVPSETCPSDGGSDGGTDPSLEPTPTDNTSDSGGTTTEGNAVAPQLVTEDGVADGSVAVSHTPEVGAPSATVTVPNACAGTVYYTGLLQGA